MNISPLISSLSTEARMLLRCSLSFNGILTLTNIKNSDLQKTQNQEIQNLEKLPIVQLKILYFVGIFKFIFGQIL